MLSDFPQLTPNCIIDAVENVTAPAAYWLLDAVGCSNDEACFQTQTIKIKDLVKKDSISWLSADAVKPILFWGGPPTRLGWYQGSLQDLLVDRILDYYTKNSLEVLMEKLCLNVH